MSARRAGPQARATTACSACRARRTKCIRESGDTACKYCRNKDQECVFNAPAESQRPISKGYLSSLLKNIDSLELRLRELGQEPPQLDRGAIPNNQRQQAEERTQSDKQSSPSDLHSQTVGVDVRHSSPTSTGPRTDSSVEHSRVRGSSASVITQPRQGHPPQGTFQHQAIRQRSASEPQLDRSKKSTVWTLIYGPDRLLYDKERGRVHYFSPSTCFKNYVRDNMISEVRNVDQWTNRILNDISTEVDTYLMELFWTRYNNILGIVDQQAFCRDQANGASTYYTGFLHLVCLAMAYQFADKDRPEIRQVTLKNGSSLFHREVKYNLERELESLHGLTTIQAMLILSDVECARGRDDLAAMHICTSCHLAFDFGLALDCFELALTEEERHFRRRLLRSCMIYDRAWALYLGRPAVMKLCDVSSSCLTIRVAEDNDSTASPRGGQANEHLSSDQDIHGRISDALLDLAELCLKIQDIAQPRLVPGTIADEDRLLEVTVADKKLRSWHSTLPADLKWTEQNAKKAPPLFFMMHQQFHVARILLYGPYAHYEHVLGIEVAKSNVFGRGNKSQGNISPWQQLARCVTMEAAMKMAQGFSAYRQICGTSQANVLSIQQGATTCLTLMCITKASRTPETRNVGLRHLYLLMEQLQEMSDVYSSAKVICGVVKHEMENLRINFTELLTPPQTPDAFNSPPSGTHVRQGSSQSTEDSSPPPSKRPRRSKDGPIPDPVLANPPLQDSDFNLEGLFQGLNDPMQSFSHTNLTGGMLPASPIQDGDAGLTQGTTFLDSNLDSMQLLPDPMFYLHSSNPSLPMDFSAISNSFDDPSQDQINELLPSWLLDGTLFDMVDDSSEILPEISRY